MKALGRTMGRQQGTEIRKKQSVGEGPQQTVRTCSELVMSQGRPVREGPGRDTTVLGLKEVQPEEGTMGGLGCYNCHQAGGWCVL